MRPATHAPQAQAEKGQKDVQLVGPKPQRFTVAEGQLKNIASAAFPALFRLGSGALCSGYRGARPFLIFCVAGMVLALVVGPLCYPSAQPYGATAPLPTLSQIRFASFAVLHVAHLCTAPTLAPHAVSLVPDDGKSYAVATIAGRQLRETSAVGGFPRPAQPIVLYEFEGERRTAA